MHEKR